MKSDKKSATKRDEFFKKGSVSVGVVGNKSVQGPVLSDAISYFH